eukprot:2427310-Karenia_brevis.AAC.1
MPIWGQWYAAPDVAGAYFWHRANNLAKPCNVKNPHRGQVSRIAKGCFPSAGRKVNQWTLRELRLLRQEELEQLSK